MENQIWFHKYRIIKTLGRGGSSEVFLAEHIKLKTFRAIKRISKDNILHEQLLKEAHILKNLNHSCIPVIYDFEEDAHNSYIIEQYIEGQSLKMLQQQKGHFPENLIIQYAIQICELMQYLYSLEQPILYLDLNPENIIMVDNTVKLIDFGASGYKLHMNDRKYSLGTKGFAAPELYSRVSPGEGADVYGIGSLLYFMVTGRSFDSSSQSKLQREKLWHYSKKLYRIIRRCLRYYPAFRYSTVTVLKNKLLESNKSNKKLGTNSSQSICIAVAGAQNRIGTTHLAILITSYFAAKGNKSLYIEKNNSNHIFKLLKRHPNIKAKDGIYQVLGCNLLPDYHIGLPFRSEDYRVTILDYGRLHRDILEQFMEADIKLIVSGAKEWELDDTEEVLKLSCGSQDIKYLYNFTNGKRFREIITSMETHSCYRIPYEPNPFQCSHNKGLEELMDGIIEGSIDIYRRKENKS